MSRPTLKLAGRSKPQRKPSFSMLKKAIRMYRGRGVPQSVYRANALKWLKAMSDLGERHILNKHADAKWGEPGNPGVGTAQVFAPRRLGGRA